VRNFCLASVGKELVGAGCNSFCANHRRRVASGPKVNRGVPARRGRALPPPPASIPSAITRLPGYSGTPGPSLFFLSSVCCQ
jgi:hypothetical protein